MSIGIDATYVTEGIHRRTQLLIGTNGDLWHILQTLIEQRHGDTTVVKIKSHLEDKGAEQLAGGYYVFAHIAGNALADAAAEQSAQMALPTEAELLTVSRAARLGYVVVRRLAIIQAADWRSREGKALYAAPSVPAPVTVDQWLHNTLAFSTFVARGHYLMPHGCGWLRCDQCGKRRRANRFQYWLHNTCQPVIGVRSLIGGRGGGLGRVESV